MKNFRRRRESERGIGDGLEKGKSKEKGKSLRLGKEKRKEKGKKNWGWEGKGNGLHYLSLIQLFTSIYIVNHNFDKNKKGYMLVPGGVVLDSEIQWRGELYWWWQLKKVLNWFTT
ncbi:hypothetical protein AAHE18_06G208200 [Arachis hypogaea]